MRVLFVVAAFALMPLGASAQDRLSIAQGFGGIRMTSAPGTVGTLGGSVGFSLTPGIQAVGEVAWTSDVMPSTLATVVALTPVDFRLSSFSGEGGVRFLTNPHGRVSAYGETLAGFTRLSAAYDGISNPTVDVILDVGLPFLNTTEPTAGVGGGVVFQSGAVVASAGYRFNRIFANNGLASWISGGTLDVSEFRFGIGVRF